MENIVNILGVTSKVERSRDEEISGSVKFGFLTLSMNCDLSRFKRKKKELTQHDICWGL